MSLRRLAPPEIQPATFAFTGENADWAKGQIAKYPPGRQASAVISLLWKGQEQEGWVTHPMIEEIAKMLAMPFIRVLEVATFYTMFNLEPVGTYLVQVSRLRPVGCVVLMRWLRLVKSTFIHMKRQFQLTASSAGWKLNVWVLVSTPRCCKWAATSMKI